LDNGGHLKTDDLTDLFIFLIIAIKSLLLLNLHIWKAYRPSKKVKDFLDAFKFHRLFIDHF